ncbi:MAG: hypothetical protein M3Y87_25325, partial [Myxococcota bacterium]|nr:hypothetical protein [Myxococcota bacterium]
MRTPDRCGSLIVALALAAGCGAPGDRSVDGGPMGDASADAPFSGGISIAIEGSDFAFVGVETCFSAIHREAADAVVTVTWGDGASDELAGGAAACHAWTYPGPIVMSMSIAARGMRVEATRLISVVFEPAASRPTSSTTIAYDAARDRIWVVEPDASVVAVIDAVGRTRLRAIDVGARPRTVAIAGDLALVACQDEGTVRAFDADTMEPRGTIELG